jgi:purine-binding chemotaxis protein CheW
MSQVNLNPMGTEASSEEEDSNKFVIFSLAEELYGARLLEIREVVEALPTKPVPNTVPSFQGVCNLRGQIVGVLNLKRRFGMDETGIDRPVFLVFDTDSGAIATIVDKVESVSLIEPRDIETKTNIISAIPQKYITGIGKSRDRLITIVNLREILTDTELASIAESRISARKIGEKPSLDGKSA